MLILAFLGGLLTIASPCILPVVSLSLSRMGRSTWRDTVPLLFGLASAFVVAAVIATTTAHWLLKANEVARVIALLLLAGVALTLWSPRIGSWIARPMARVASRFIRPTATENVSIGENFLIGAAIGVLWAPCAGPILGLLFAAGATSGPARAAGLYFVFALGAATAIGLVLGVGARALRGLRRIGAADHVVRRVLAVATLAVVVALAFGWDSALFARASIVSTASAEEALVRGLASQKESSHGAEMSVTEFARRNARPPLPTLEGTLPSFDGATAWINSAPLTPAALRGKVVLIDFWTFACYNCLNALPHVKALEAKYRDKGFVVIGVHTPELARERVVDNVRREVKRLGIEYPVVIDNDYKIWNAFHNQYWPAAYYADATGTLRFYHFGEGEYDAQDQVVATLLREAATQRP